MNIETKKLSELTPAEWNPRTISEAALKGLRHSIRRFGLVQPIIWNKQTGNVVGGHQRLQAMKQEGITETKVMVVDIPLIEEKALNVTLNNKTIEGEFTPSLSDILAEIHTAMPDAFEELALDDLAASMSGIFNKHEDVEEDEVPEAPEVPVTKPGDLWELGDHRLLCGDATNSTDVDRLLGGNRAAMIFTDPPWNVALSKWGRKRIQNDDLKDGFDDFFHGWCATSLLYLDGDIYCVMSPSEWGTICDHFRKSGIHQSGVIVWIKDSFVVGRSQYHHRFEPIWYGWPDKSKSSYVGGRAQDDVWEFKRPRVSAEHPTMKPVGLVAKAVASSSIPGDVVLDPFMGSGTTLLACQQLKRRAYGLEIEPRFCDVIIKRWETATNQKAVLSVGT